jgi:predicted nucleic acid-binding protein
MNYLLDTNVISELISKQANKKVAEWLDGLDPNTVYLSVITIGEIRKGIEKLPDSKRKDKVREWLETDLLIRFQGRVLEITIEVMLAWGALTRRLENEGRPITAIDSLIAAIALQGNYCLVTRNEFDFRHTGVTMINPWKQA